MRKTIVALALLSGGLLSSVALGQSWGNFEAAFPMFPCHDGWMACRIDGQVVSPDLARDGAGMPVPSDFRLGWFDLQPTAAFSPFGGLSVYTGEEPARIDPPAPEPDAVAVAPAPAPAPTIDPEIARREQEAAAERRRLQEQESALADAQRQRDAEERAAQSAAAAAAQASARAEAERKKAEEDAAKKRAEEAALAKQLQAAQADDERKRIEAEQKRLAEERKKAEAEAARKKAEEDARRKAEEEARIKAEAEAKARAEAERKADEERKRIEAERKAQEEAARKLEEERRVAEAKAKEEADRLAAEAAKKREEEERAKAAAAAATVAAPAPTGTVVAAAAATDSGDCTDIVSLEPHAMLGRLSDGQIKCLEGSLTAAAKMTDKDKISRVLMLNAFGKGDTSGWEKLVKRHLAEIDQSDPDLCYKYALHLGKKGAGAATSVIHWSDVALENRTVWTGDTYTNRVFSLYKMRAAAAQQLWQKAEADFASAPSEQVQADIDKWRAQTKVLSREWYEYAKVSGKDSSKALQLCMSAAGTREYCEAG